MTLRKVHYIGTRGTREVPPGQNFFIFMQFWGEIDQIVGEHSLKIQRLLWEIQDPPLL